jgi:hypothetical protein
LGWCNELIDRYPPWPQKTFSVFLNNPTAYLEPVICRCK